MRNKNWVSQAVDYASMTVSEVGSHVAMALGATHAVGSMVASNPGQLRGPNAVLETMSGISGTVNETAMDFMNNITSMNISSPTANLIGMGMAVAVGVGGLLSTIPGVRNLWKNAKDFICGTSKAKAPAKTMHLTA